MNDHDETNRRAPRKRDHRVTPQLLNLVVGLSLSCTADHQGDKTALSEPQSLSTRPEEEAKTEAANHDAETHEQPAAVQGVTISTHRIGLEWGTDVIAPTLDHITTVGANWVAIHPYAFIGNDGSLSWKHFDRDRYRESIARPIREAHRRGLKILVKPHLAYWGSRFSWRGEIDFEEPSARERFFREHSAWIVAIAGMAQGADALSVGCELDRLVQHNEAWRALIRQVRKINPAPLTYAANWSSYRQVGFWDALDAIGIQAYFPVAEENDPSESSLRRGWATTMGELRRYSTDMKRPVVFTELGYNRSMDAARTPWDDRVDNTPEALALQERVYRVALEAIAAEPSVLGSFLWKWFPEPYPNGRTFVIATDAMKATLCEYWCPTR